jgi:hypothetical protein
VVDILEVLIKVTEAIVIACGLAMASLSALAIFVIRKRAREPAREVSPDAVPTFADWLEDVFWFFNAGSS